MKLARLAMAAFLAVASPAIAEAPAASREAQLEDLDFIRARYMEKERAYSPEERAAADAILAELRAKAGTLTNEQLFLGISQVVAAADNAHSRTSWGSAETAPKTVWPLRLAWFDAEGFVVLRALPPQADLAGAVVTAIEGRPVAEVVDALEVYFSGPEPRRMIFMPGLMGEGGMLHAAGLTASPDKVRLTLKGRDGRVFEREVVYEAPMPGAPAWWPSRWWSPEPIAGDARPWASAIDAADLPLYLQDADRFHRVVPLPDLDALYVEFKTNEADRGARGFASASEREIKARKPKNLILDFRFNKGGDLNLNAEFMEKVATMVPADGKVYVIVGRYTFSAGIVPVAIAKKAGGDKVVLVGEEVSDRLRFWSEGDTACTPNSKICARYTDGYFDLADGCKGESGCWRDNARYDFVVGSLEPELKAPMTTVAYFAKRDPALEAIRADLGK